MGNMLPSYSHHALHPQAPQCRALIDSKAPNPRLSQEFPGKWEKNTAQEY
jgi:hypothetical protein